MRVGILRSLAALLAGTGVVTAQVPVSGNGSPGLSGQMMSAAPGQVAPAEPPPSYSPLAHSDGWAPSGCSNCGLGDDCPRPTHQFYGGAEFLLWHFRHYSLPTIATAVPVGLLQVTNQDRLAVSGGSVPFGPPQTFLVPVSLVSNPTINRDLNPGDQIGGRATIGYWLDPAQRFGIEASALYIHPQVTNFISTTGNSVNQFSVDTGIQTHVFAVPGGPAISTADLAVARQTTATTLGDYRTQLLGAELNGRCVGCSIGAVTVSGLAGARYLEFRDGLSVSNNVALTAIPGVPDGATTGFPQLVNFGSFDTITMRNRYYAPQVGAEMEIEEGCFFFSARAKVAVGAMQQIANIFGTSTVVGSSNPGTFVGGLFSDPLNQGRRDRTRVSVVPEANLKVGFQFNNWLRSYVGYDYLYLQHVIRPSTIIGSSSINTQVTVNGTTQTINVTQPAIHFKDQDAWMQGINLGVELRY
jgi:hypothetical protein